jgi:hypothetical protein
MSGFVSEICGANKNGVIKIMLTLKKIVSKESESKTCLRKSEILSWIIRCTYHLRWRILKLVTTLHLAASSPLGAVVQIDRR